MLVIVKEKLCLILIRSTLCDRPSGCYNLNFGQIRQILSHGATHRR